MILESEIRQKIALVAARKLQPWDIYDWLDENNIDMHGDSSRRAIELVGAIDHIFAEYDRRVYGKERLFEKLVSLLNSSVVFEEIIASSRSVIRVLPWSPS